MEPLYIWSVNGAEGVMNGAYLGFFNSKGSAITYLRENVGGEHPFSLYRADRTSSGVELTEVSVQVAS